MANPNDPDDDGDNDIGNPGKDDKDNDAVCYLRSTHILTPAGETAVEDLKIGDEVVTRWNGIRAVKWIGRQSFGFRFIEGNRDRIPVRIAAGALGANRPIRDLIVSPGHSILLDDTLVLARSLVNGVTITQGESPDEIHYYQLDLGFHDCVIAEGTWSETYADDGLREHFHNGAEFYALNPEYIPPEEMTLCAPRPERGAKLGAVLRPVVERALMQVTPGPVRGYLDRIGSWKIDGWALDSAHPELPVLLEVLLGDRLLGTVLACDRRDDLAAAGLGQGQCSFSFTSPVRIEPSMAAKMLVRRASDGSQLEMTDRLRASLAKDDQTESGSPPRLKLVA